MIIKTKIAPIQFAKTLLIIVFFLLLAHILYLISRFFYGYSYRDYLKLFYLDHEENFPTLYATTALMVASLLLFIVGYIKKRLKQGNHFFWYVLSIIFLLLSYDEASSMHEYINDIFWQKYPDLPVYLGFGWVIPYFFLTIIIGLLSIKFLKSLSKRTSILFITAGAVYVAGAIGMEMFGAYLWANAGGQDSLLYNFFATMEELLEMLGVVIFIYAILDYMKMEFGEFVIIEFKNSETEKLPENSHVQPVTNK